MIFSPCNFLQTIFIISCLARIVLLSRFARWRAHWFAYWHKSCKLNRGIVLQSKRCCYYCARELTGLFRNFLELHKFKKSKKVRLLKGVGLFKFAIGFDKRLHFKICENLLYLRLLRINLSEFVKNGLALIRYRMCNGEFLSKESNHFIFGFFILGNEELVL